MNFTVTTSACDSDGRLKLYSALQMMQDCSEMWLESEPEVKHYFEDHGMAQLLVSRQVEVVRVPAYGERLAVATSVYEVKPMFGFRNTFITDAHGQPCYRTWSMGAFVDKSAGRLARIADGVMSSVVVEPRREMTYGDRRVAVPKQGGREAEAVRVLRADIDYNRHVNNAAYVRMAMELLPEGFVTRGLRVEYRVPARLGDVLRPTVYRQGDKCMVVALSLESDVCSIIEFSE